MIGDGVVVWRGAALWGYSWICMAIMLLPLLGDLGEFFDVPLSRRLLIRPSSPAVYLYFLGCEGQSEWWYIAGTQAKQCVLRLHISDVAFDSIYGFPFSFRLSLVSYTYS